MSRAATLVVALLLPIAGCGHTRISREAEEARFEADRTAREARLALSPDRLLSLAECESLALANSLEYATTLLEARVRDEEVRGARAALLPSGGAEFDVTARSNEPLLKTPGGVAALGDQETAIARVNAALPILDFGATWQAYRIAQDRRDRARLLAERARQTLLRDVRVAYTRAAAASRAVGLLEAEVGAFDEALRVAGSLEREGLAARADTAFVKAALARAELDLAVARSDERLLRARLSRTMSAPATAVYRLELAPSAAPRLPERIEEVRALEDAALRRRPEVGAQVLARDEASAEVRRAYAAQFPRITGSLDFEWSTDSQLVNPSFVLAGLSVAQALFDLPVTIARRRVAQRAEAVEAHRTLVVSMGVVYEVDFRLLELARARDAFAARAAQVEAQERLLEVVTSRHREGLETTAERMRAQADLHAARRAQDSALADAAVAGYELRAATGDDAATDAVLFPAAPVSLGAIPPASQNGAER